MSQWTRAQQSLVDELKGLHRAAFGTVLESLSVAGVGEAALRAGPEELILVYERTLWCWAGCRVTSGRRR